jgi:hypothetical protein
MQDKSYTKMILERLSKKSSQNQVKKDEALSVKTQATPNDDSDSKPR